MKKKAFATITPQSIEKLTRSLLNKIPAVHDILDDKMNAIVQVVYTTARARRPKLSAQEIKTIGLPRYFRRQSSGKMKEYRASDPNASVGVPVDTGALQESIKKEVTWSGDKVIGRIWAGENIPYANAIEYGTSRIEKRPFMRPAYNENLQWIKKKFKEKSS
jgi:HK97 gp10 family phage protein